jgi:MoaA/NifB/PqqE/SkfB family radical SAM enzyme
MATIPPGVLLQIFRPCNYACRHCSQTPPLATRADIVDATKLSSAEHLRSLSRIGIRRVRLMGGEAFLHPRLRELVELALELGFELSFVTNGSQLGEENLRWLRDLGPLETWISFYGYPAAVHDWMCGRAGSFQHTISTVERLHADGHPVGIHYPLEEATAAGADAFVRLIVNKGAARVKIMQLFEQGNGSREFNGRCVGEQDLRLALEAVRLSWLDTGGGYDVSASVRSGQRATFERSGWVIAAETGCHAGLQGYWTVDADGWTYPCCLYLGNATMRIAHVSDPRLAAEPTAFDNRAFAKRIGVPYGPAGPKLEACPALYRPTSAPKATEFICPLTYARPSAADTE